MAAAAAPRRRHRRAAKWPFHLNLSARSSGLCAHLQRREKAGEGYSAREPHSGRPCERVCWSWRPCTAVARRCCASERQCLRLAKRGGAMGHRGATPCTKPASAALASDTNRATSRWPGALYPVRRGMVSAAPLPLLGCAEWEHLPRACMLIGQPGPGTIAGLPAHVEPHE